MAQLTAGEARRMALRAQGLAGAPDRRAGVPGMLRALGLVQLDTISVLARSHELVPYARLGAVGRATVEHAYWAQPARAFEYWAHAACILPIEDWPWCAFRRRKAWTYEGWKQVESERTFKEVRARLADAPGGLTATELGGAKKGGVWWDWSDTKIALERLLHHGEVVCVERRGWKRVYRLAVDAIPAALLDKEPSEGECRLELIAAAGRALGVATTRELAEYYRMAVRSVPPLVADSGLVPVEVQGWTEPAWADPVALAAMSARSGGRERHRTTLLSPFDSLVWDRPRTLRMFGYAHAIEAYKPAPTRIYGYYAMPILAGGRLIGRVDPKREGRTLVARQVALSSVSAAAVANTARALREAATWVGCDSVSVERVEPSELARPLAAAVAG
jgi:uncharacterized protein YcaQ